MIINIVEKIVEFIESSGAFGVILCSLIMSIESIVPILPLGVFITVNFLILGSIWGFIISWFFTVIGCNISYFVFRNGFADRFENLTSNKQLIKKYTKIMKNISLGKLILIVAFPFTPAFVINIVSGLSKLEYKKFLISILIGKVSLVYFYGFVGTSLIDSIKNPIVLIKVIAITLSAYLLYLLINKVLKIK